MSTMDDIRAFMARQAGPVTPAQVAEALELEGKKVRGAMYQAANQGAGIERLDDGTYSLIPGWKPTCKPAEAESVPTPAAKPAKTPRVAKARKPAKAKKAAKRASKRTTKAAPAAAPTLSLAATATVTRICLTTLVAAVLDGDVPITGRLRSALREASAATSQG
ncbi:hypothetical protein [Arenimonas caeni]|uniref:Uncharacterized protein n=1 Tax=Arenimonas caeni TaxID=2058085 RepID=A0A2P6MA05_9GAMM|nr:hypothetical protein [Arenimonas caeni]PRH82837.1 hypothetical protein C6N40_06425 [Arenimonas caeni]